MIIAEIEENINNSEALFDVSMNLTFLLLAIKEHEKINKKKCKK